jgi:hypothetical protein
MSCTIMVIYTARAGKYHTQMAQLRAAHDRMAGPRPACHNSYRGAPGGRGGKGRSFTLSCPPRKVTCVLSVLPSSLM